MRHRYYGRKLNRDIKERKALFRSLIDSLIVYRKIKTTYTKAKSIQSLTEKLVTLAKSTDSNSKRFLGSYISHKKTQDIFVTDIVPKLKDKVGGYIRIRRIGRRPGDGSEEVFMEWTIPEDARPKKEDKLTKVTKKENIKEKKVSK